MSLSFSHFKSNQIDLSKVKSIEPNRLITFVNHFISSMVSQCNELIYLVDSRLNCINRQLNICQANLLILETKLNSITGLHSVSIKETSDEPFLLSKANINETRDERGQEEKKEEKKEKNNDNSEEKEKEEKEEKEEKVKTEEEALINQSLIKYKRMLHFGIPLNAVQHKMKADGLNQSLIDSLEFNKSK